MIKKEHKPIVILAGIAAVLVIFFFWQGNHGQIKHWVAQNDGKWRGLEGMDEAYKAGFRLFEVKVEWSGDGKHIVTQATPDILSEWLKNHEGAKLVVKFDDRVPLGFKKLAEQMGGGQDRIVAQIYKPKQYLPVYNLGYKEIIWNLERMDAGLNKKRLNTILQNQKYYAVSMPISMTGKEKLVDAIEDKKIPIFSNNINNCGIYKKAVKGGITGAYTAQLQPGSCGS